MIEPNYQSKWWGYIYDQIMADQQDLVDANLRFYQNHLQNKTGSVLECACGTGLIFLPLLALGFDMYGFDISSAMLSSLQIKAAQLDIHDIDRRISVQELETFHYPQRFTAILIPTNTFVMLSTQEAQIRALRNIHAHLAPGGKLLLDVRLAGVRDLADGKLVVQGSWYTWTHPESGLPIRQRVIGQVDFNNQLVDDRCFIEYENESVDFPMTSRWIFKEEFTLLLRLAGFAHWTYLATPEGKQLDIGLEGQQSYWVIEKGT